MSKKLAIAMFGQKRLSREGGVEIVVKELCTRMAQNGCDVTCYNRAGHHVSGAEYDDATIEYAAETEVADKPRQPVNYAGRVAEHTADNVRKPSVLVQLHAKQAERTAEPQKSQKRKSYDMEL